MWVQTHWEGPLLGPDDWYFVGIPDAIELPNNDPVVGFSVLVGPDDFAAAGPERPDVTDPERLPEIG